MKNTLSLILLYSSFISYSQVGTIFFNYEESNYIASMKSSSYTYLIWDRNHNGSGLFSSADRPMFMYWDSDNNQFGYLIDTRNMERLKAKLYSLNVSNNLSIPNGIVAIGTTSTPAGYKLAVSGKIVTEEIKVASSGTSPWPDYVFSPTYNLRSLKETEAYIKENSHLPDVPSAKKIEENGIMLGEMNAILLRKIEELTLYTIKQQELIEEQRKMIEEVVKKSNKKVFPF